MRIRWLTIDDTIVRTAGELRGLAAVRAVLVFTLVAFQSVEVSQSFARVFSTPLWIIPAIAAASLFAPMGFALAQARERSTRRRFLVRRLWAGWPPLIAAVALSAVIIGPVATSLGITDYVTDPQTYLYFLGLVGFPQFSLPGVFEFNDLVSLVNPALWLAPAYISVVAIVSLPAPRYQVVCWVGASLVLVAVAASMPIIGVTPSGNLDLLAYFAPVIGAAICAVLGALAFSFRAIVPHDWRLAVLCGLVLIAIAFVGDQSWARDTLFAAIAAVPGAYLILWVCLSRSRGGDIWYRLRPYLAPLILSAFPIQQATVAFGPRDQNALINLIISLPAALGFAGCVGYFIQRRRMKPELPDHPWDGAVLASGRRRQRSAEPLVHRLRNLLLMLALGLLLVAVVLALFALTLFAMQRDPGGI